MEAEEAGGVKREVEGVRLGATRPRVLEIWRLDVCR
jgi:hypothetical protein